MRPIYTFPGGIHPPENKDGSSQTPIRSLPLPPQLHIALRQSVGNAALPCVQAGDYVQKGQIIAKPDGRLSVAVHASSSGTIRAMGPHPFAHPSGLPEQTITIDTDGLDAATPPQPLTHWPQCSSADIREHLANMGVVGLGGAVFPTHLKLAASALETLIINGAECEPYISCDDRLMRERADAICQGAAIARHALQAAEVLIGIEDNKPQAIAAMQAAAAPYGFSVISIPTIYPSGGAKQLIRILTGKAIPHGERSTAHGVQCLNVGTVYAIARAVVDGEPLISRIVTLTGAVGLAANAEALIGTPLDWLLNHAQPHEPRADVIMGGPMMGFTIPDMQAGLSKAGNCLIAKSAALFPPRPDPQACIRCGDCASACPVALQPMDLYWFAKANNLEKARQWDLFDCIECGACSYVCPSQIPLVDYYRFAKSEIRSADQEKKAANLARQRHEFRQFRIERDKSEKAQRLAERAAAQAAKLQAADNAQASASAANPQDDAKKAAIAAALARASTQRDNVPSASAATTEDAKKAAIEAAMARAAARKTAADAIKAGIVPEPATPVVDDAKKAAIEAAMARAAARKAAKDAANLDTPASSTPNDAKKAAIEAAMARAAARQSAAHSTATPSIDSAQQSVIDAALARSGARQSSSDTPAAPGSSGLDDAKKAAIEAAMARAAARKAAKDAANLDNNGAS